MDGPCLTRGLHTELFCRNSPHPTFPHFLQGKFKSSEHAIRFHYVITSCNIIGAVCFEALHRHRWKANCWNSLSNHDSNLVPQRRNTQYELCATHETRLSLIFKELALVSYGCSNKVPQSSDLKLCEVIILDNRTAEVCCGPHRPKTKVGAGLSSFWRVLGDSASRPFPALRISCIPWLTAPSIIQARDGALASHRFTPTVPPSSPLPP